jgi:hypothetical protein
VRGLLAALALLIAGCAQTPGGTAPLRATVVPQTDRLRADYNPQDVPFNAQTLGAAFRDIAFNAFNAVAVATGYGGVKRDVLKSLSRWEKPIRWAVNGDGVTDADREEVRRLLARISTLTGRRFLEIASLRPTLQIQFLTPASRKTKAAKAAPFPNAALALDALGDGGLVCTFLLYTDVDDSSIVKTLTLIRSEASGMVRRACLHKGILNSMGLRNSSPDARLSVLKDDEEFALMTYHDELLLRILYDPRLKTGMSEADAMPIVHDIIVDFDLFDRVHAANAWKKGPSS